MKFTFTLILLFLLISIGVAYSLNIYITLPSCIILLLLTAWVILRKIVEVSIFPGYSWFWKRGLESNYCKEISIQISEKLKNLKEFLQSVVAKDYKFQELYTQNSRRVIESLIENYEAITNQLSRRQLELYNLLKYLKDSLEETVVIVNTTERFVMWMWIEVRLECFVTSGFCPDTSESSPIMTAISLCDSIIRFLEDCHRPKNCLKKFLRFSFDNTIGSLDYMRADLNKRFNCKELTINNGNVLINCLYITAEDSRNITFLMCNPNAGYYEFRYFQSEWLEFYISRRINVFLWNYRGYGKSKGQPTITNIINDGKAIMSYIKSQINPIKIGIHGESLGGSVAIQLANLCGCDFLFADRTFGCLSDTILFHFGRTAYWCYKISGCSDINSVNSYLQANCYKLIAVDSADDIIPDTASLKSSIALKVALGVNESIGKLFMSNKLEIVKNLIDAHDYWSLFKSLKALTEMSKSEIEYKEINRYLPITKTEFGDDIDLKSVLNKFMSILNDLDAGGMPLGSVFNNKNPEIGLFLWILVLQTWGSSSSGTFLTSEQAIETSLNDMKIIIIQIKNPEGFQIRSHLETVSEVLDKILRKAQEKASVSSGETARFHDGTSRSGFLLPVKCGHSGQLSPSEKTSYEKHLYSSRLL